MSITSSTLLAKLEELNWSYAINATLQGVQTNLLVKYIVLENAYAVMLTDFASTYFECLIGEEIEKHYHRFNMKARQLPYQQVLHNLSEMLQDLRKCNMLTFERLLVECHTTRINIKTSKMFSSGRMNWNFYIISTEQDIFMKHFSLPLWRGVMHLYTCSKNSINNNINSHSTATNGSEACEERRVLAQVVNQNVDLATFFEDSILKDVFL